MKRVKDLPRFGRPREKLKEKGVKSLSDTELIAIIIGSGNKGQDEMAISSKVSKLIAQNGSELSLENLSKIDGIGLAKAAQILAGFELARRHQTSKFIRIASPLDALPMLSDIRNKQQEYFVCISLSGANEIIEKRIVTVGLLNKTQVHPREVFADVIADRAASVILAHNHPSGTLQPSKSDLKMHQQLVEAGKILGITILDHIIVTKNGYLSFQEEGFI